MIKSDNGKVTITGSMDLVLAEFATLVKGLLMDGVADWNLIMYCLNMVKDDLDGKFEEEKK